MVIDWCSDCGDVSDIPVKVGETYSTSSADFAYCGVCGRYGGRYGGQMQATVDLVSEEPCDCGEHTRHNNGGNYHYKTWNILSIGG